MDLQKEFALLGQPFFFVEIVADKAENAIIVSAVCAVVLCWRENKYIKEELISSHNSSAINMSHCQS